MMRTKKNVAFLLVIAIAVISLAVFTGCRSRKTIESKTEVSKSNSTQSESKVKSNETVNSVDNTKSESKSVTEAKNSQKDSTEIEADSVVTEDKPDGTRKTTVYIKKGSKIKSTSLKNNDQRSENTTYVNNDVKSTSNKVLDSAGKSKEKTSSDSTRSDKDKTVKGIAADYSVILTIGAIVVIGFIVYRSMNKKKS